MSAWIPAAVAAGAEIAGGLWQTHNAQSIAQKQMDFQREMSSTAYQRAVKDMRAAGINPILAASQGGASTPGGAGFQPENYGSKGVASALALRQAQANIRLTEAQSKAALADAAQKTVKSLPFSEFEKLYNSARSDLVEGLHKLATGDDSSAKAFLDKAKSESKKKYGIFG